MYVCMYVCMYVPMYVCVYACMHVCMYACMYVCVYVCLGPLITLWDANVKHRLRRKAIAPAPTVSACARGQVGRATAENGGWVGTCNDCISGDISRCGTQQ